MHTRERSQYICNRWDAGCHYYFSGNDYRSGARGMADNDKVFLFDAYYNKERRETKSAVPNETLCDPLPQVRA